MIMQLSLIVPCYNEEYNLNAFYQAVKPILMQHAPNHEIIFINDGSRDDSLRKLIELSRSDVSVRILDLSRNFGKEAALTAGLDVASGDAVIPMDADLQHPPELIPALLERWREGFDMVLARRQSRRVDHPAQQFMARAFYRLHNLLSDTTIPEEVGDFRLMDRRVIEALRCLPESRRFMKGIYAWVGFRTSSIEFDVATRHTGQSRYSGRKLLHLALEGITSFSIIPLRIWTYIGSLISIIALFSGLWIVAKTIFYGTDLPGYPSLFSAILLLGGVQLIGIGVLGEYIGRIYSEVKHRPIYLVREQIGFQNSNLEKNR